MVNIKVITEFSEDTITTSCLGEDSAHMSYVSQVLHLREEGIKAALQKMGWVAPEDVPSVKADAVRDAIKTSGKKGELYRFDTMRQYADKLERGEE